jgi:selenium metabolism protein YedF
MEKRIDARGKACPQPVLLTREAILSSGADTIRVTVDNETSAENVRRMASSQGWEPAVERKGDDYDVVLTRGSGAVDPTLEQEVLSCDIGPPGTKLVVFVTSSLFGEGDEELGRVLMRSFVKTLKDLDPRPATLIFANSGVKITTEGSDLLDDLKALEEEGAEILSCGTCLDYYNRKETLAVGRASNMYEIATALVDADKVVKP